MKKLVVVMGLVGLLLAACGTIRIDPETPAATGDVVATDEPTGQVEPTAEAETTEPAVAPDAAGEGVSLNYPSDAIGAATFTQVAAAAPDTPPWGLLPQHVEVTFGQYPALGSIHRPAIYVFPVDDLEALSDLYPPIVERLRSLLDEQPPVDSSLMPVALVPIQNAMQTMMAQGAYVRFQNGRGVRFYTHFAQAYLPVTDADGFYTFQGLTDDGQYYVSAILPAGQADLPATTPDLNGWLAEPIEESYAAYVAETTAALEAADPSSFTPTLAELDALIESLKVEAAPGM